MITVGKGNLFDQDTEAVVNTVNCVGVMGRGIALQCKQRYPDNFKVYLEACKRGELSPGRLLIFQTGGLSNPKYIINFPTKVHWRNASRTEYIESGMKALADFIRSNHVKSIAMPPLGCGLGRLSWSVVRPLIEKELAAFPELDCRLFEPEYAPVPHEVVDGRFPAMTTGRAALLELMSRFLRAGLTPYITVLETQKLMYFLQIAGEPLNLSFAKGIYGPYAQNLRFVLRALNGHYMTGYSDGGDDPYKPLELVPGASSVAEVVLSKYPDTQSRVDRVMALIKGFEDDFAMELLSTVHWLYVQERCLTPDAIEAGIADWTERKRRLFKRFHVDVAYDRLKACGWL